MGMARPSFAPPMQQSASAEPIFVGPVIQAPLPSPMVRAPFTQQIVPQSIGAPKTRAFAPPLLMGNGKTSAAPPAAAYVVPPTTDQSMVAPPTASWKTQPGVAERNGFTPAAPAAPAPMKSIFKPVATATPADASAETGEPTFVITKAGDSDGQYLPGGSGSAGSGPADDQNKIAAADPADNVVASAGGGGAGLAIAAIAAYFLFF